MQNTFNTLAKAKLMLNTKNKTFRIVAAFNVTQKDAKGNWLFPVQKKCNFVSGDFNYATIEKDKPRILKQMYFALRTNNVMFV